MSHLNKNINTIFRHVETVEVSSDFCNDLQGIITTTTPSSAVTQTRPMTTTTTPSGLAKTCHDTDSRGVEWTVTAGKRGVISCSSDGFTVQILGEAYWVCNEEGTAFVTEEPDRSNCTESWIKIVEIAVSEFYLLYFAL